MPDLTPPTRDRASTIAALTALIPGANPESMNVVVTETTAEGDRHSWSGSLAGLADRIHAHDAAFPPITAHVVVTRTPVTVTKYGAQYRTGEVNEIGFMTRERAERTIAQWRANSGRTLRLVQCTSTTTPWVATEVAGDAA